MIKKMHRITHSSKNKKLKKSSFKRFWLISMILLLLLTMIGCGSSGSSEESETLETSEAPDPAKVETPAEPTEEQKQAFIDFKVTPFDYSERQSKIFGLMVEAEEKMIAGEASALDMYEFVGTAKDSIESIWTAYNDIKVPESLSNEHQKILKDAISSLSTSAWLHKEAYEAYQEYLDKGSLEKATEFKDNIESAQRHTLNASAGFVQVQMELGIEN